MNLIKKLLVLAVLAAMFSSSLLAQQEGAVALSGQIETTSKFVVDDFVSCVEKLVVVGFKPDKAGDQCQKAAKIQAKMVSDMSDDVSGATKSSRPVIVNNGRGWGRSSFGFGIGPRRPIVIMRAPRPSRPPREHRQPNSRGRN